MTAGCSARPSCGAVKRAHAEQAALEAEREALPCTATALLLEGASTPQQKRQLAPASTPVPPSHYVMHRLPGAAPRSRRGASSITNCASSGTRSPSQRSRMAPSTLRAAVRRSRSNSTQMGRMSTMGNKMLRGAGSEQALLLHLIKMQES